MDKLKKNQAAFPAWVTLTSKLLLQVISVLQICNKVVIHIVLKPL